jgi:hypothetical protein
MISNGFPIDEECHRLLDEMTHVLTCETPYNRELYIEARRRGIKTYDQYNFEFQDLLIKPKMAQPTKFLAPFLCLPMNEALTSGLPVIMSNVSPNDAILPQEWLVPGAFNGCLTSRVPIQYFNANISVLARKPDELATMSYDVLDQQKTRALELSRQWDPEVLRPQYEAVLAGCRPGPSASEPGDRKHLRTWDQKTPPWRYRAPQRAHQRSASVVPRRTSESLLRSPRFQWHIRLRGCQSAHAR